MIEVIDTELCTGCNICVRVCPTNVLDLHANAIPTVARLDDCQTCFLCEVYCPEDAIYVHPNADSPVGMTQVQVRDSGLLGTYRRAIGWTKDTRDNRASDASYLILGKG